MTTGDDNEYAPNTEREVDVASEEGIYTVDVTEASQALGVSLARLSQLTSKGTLSHVRRRVGARWRIFYRRDEIDEMARVHRAVVYHRPPAYVPLPLPPPSLERGQERAQERGQERAQERGQERAQERSGEISKETKDGARAGARGRAGEPSPGTWPAPSPWEATDEEPAPSAWQVERGQRHFLAPPARFPTRKEAHFGYGGVLARADALEEQRNVQDTLARLEAGLAAVFPRLEGLEASLSEVSLGQRALRLGVGVHGHFAPRTRSLPSATSLVARSEQTFAPETTPELPTLHGDAQGSETEEATALPLSSQPLARKATKMHPKRGVRTGVRVRFEKGRDGR